MVEYFHAAEMAETRLNRVEAKSKGQPKPMMENMKLKSSDSKTPNSFPGRSDVWPFYRLRMPMCSIQS